MSTNSEFVSTDDPPTLRVRGPGDLVQAVPFLLGFHPAQSLVLIGMSQRQVVVTARVDLVDLESELLTDTVGAIVRGGAHEFVAMVFDDTTVPVAAEQIPRYELVSELALEAERIDAELTDALFVSKARMWSYFCSDNACCPPEGRPLGADSSTVPAAATYAGLVALPDRDSLAALLEPVSEADRCALESRLLGAEDAALKRILAGRDAREQRSVKRALFAAARIFEASGPSPSLGEDDIVRYGAALTGYPVRDAVWMAVDDGRLDGRGLWRQLAMRLPGPYAAAPLFLFAWASWRHGNGALARMAAERAIACDPAYSAADLLLAALSRGIDPRRMPKLRCARSA